LLQRHYLKKLYFSLLVLTGRRARLLRDVQSKDEIVVVNLHQVSPERNPFWDPLDPRVFEALLVFIKRHFRVTTFVECSSRRGSKPDLILSFDDGYYDFVEYAMPLLARHGLPANQNVIVSCVQDGRPPWHTRIYDFLNSVPRSLVNEIRLPGFETRLESEDRDDKVAYGLALSRFLKRRSRADRDIVWQPIEKVMERADRIKSTRMMRISDVRDAAQSHEIGTHSFAHDSMEFEAISFFNEDLRACRRFFDESLGLPLSIYAFPNGGYRPEQIEVLRMAGVRHILLVNEAFAARDQDVYPRLTIYGDSLAETSLRALGHSRIAP
jgi:peptidoglycan/xylan/chitin deacetylase (PgdA/CDA1 family)